MKARLAGLLFASLLAIGSGIGVASAVSFDRSYADPTSDVVELWASNMTPVLTDGNLTMSPFPDSVNVLRLASADAGTVYAYRDSGWQSAGSPGSEPTLPGAPSVLATWAWIAVVPVAIAIATVVVMVLRERKRGSTGKLRSQRDEVPSFHRRGKP